MYIEMIDILLVITNFIELSKSTVHALTSESKYKHYTGRKTKNTEAFTKAPPHHP